ncbi:hypothetical protein FJZ33_01510 [Candidatus Poribacteria bacterium]|nr:hypothetical protein [Candidatus Poribacteria bacterium]
MEVLCSQADFDRLIPDLLTKQVPGFLVSVILLLVLASSMSTLDSIVLVSASSVAIDMHKGYIDPKASSKKILGIMRILSIVFVLISFVIARFEFAIIITLMSLSWGAVAGSFMAAYLYGLYWKRATRVGIWCGMLGGLGINISMFFILGPANSPIASSMAMIGPFIIIPLISSFTKPPEKDLIDKAFK